MQDEREYNVPAGLYQAEFGKMVLNYTGRVHPTILLDAMEKRAIQTLEAIRQVLADDSYDDPECFERVDTLVMLFYKELGVRIDRHSDLD